MTGPRPWRPSRLGLLLAGALLLVASAAAGPTSSGHPAGDRVVPGRGGPGRGHALTLATDVAVRWLVAAGPRRLAAVDADGGLWLLEVGRAGLAVSGRYGGSLSAEAAPVAARVGPDRTGVVALARDGRLAVWEEGSLRTWDVGTPLAPTASPLAVSVSAEPWDDLVAVAADGALVLLAGLPAGPRTVARLEVNALLDARLTRADLDGDGVPEVLVLSDPSDRYDHGVLGDRLEATSLSVLSPGPRGLVLRARLTLAPPAVFEALSAVVASARPGGRPALLLARSLPHEGAAVVALGYREGVLAVLGEGPAEGRRNRWVHVLGSADLSGDGVPEVLAVRTPHVGGILTAYHWRSRALAPVAQASGYSSHALGSRNLGQALVADLDGNGRFEVVLPRQSRESVVGLELEGGRFVERWSQDLRGPLQSNLLAGDLDGDGVIDLALADRAGLRVFLGAR